MAAMGSNESLSLKQISQKLAVLMALMKASRTSELRVLDIQFRVYRPNGVVFILASLTKKRTPGLPPKELFFGAFPSDKCLCVVECEVLRGEGTRVPTTRVCREAVVSVIRSPTQSSNISEAGPLGQGPLGGCWGPSRHSVSVLGASTSATMARGVPLADILGNANWSRESTFRRFYERETETNNASKVLQVGESLYAIRSDNGQYVR